MRRGEVTSWSLPAIASSSTRRGLPLLRTSAEMTTLLSTTTRRSAGGSAVLLGFRAVLIEELRDILLGPEPKLLALGLAIGKDRLPPLATLDVLPESLANEFASTAMLCKGDAIDFGCEIRRKGNGERLSCSHSSSPDDR
jgi:hypothetical protein